MADKPSRLVAGGDPIVVDGAGRLFVSRGGDKLAAALDRFPVVVVDRRCLDTGASTGGFTDCLLQRGAADVTAVDVGYGQLHPRLRDDPRVAVRERTNVRSLDTGDGHEPFGLVVADLAFISLTAVVPTLVALAAPGADLVVLVKPQFEVGHVAVSRGRGVVRDQELRRAALDRVASALVGAGASIMGAMASPVLGPAGNAEYLLWARTGPPQPPPGFDLDAALDAAIASSPDVASVDSGSEDPASADPASADPASADPASADPASADPASGGAVPGAPGGR